MNVVDALIYLGESRFRYGLSAAAASELLDRHKISAAMAAPPHPVDSHFGRANEELAELVDGSSGRLHFIARVDPWDGDSAANQLAHAQSELGARGVLLHPAEEHFKINDPVVLPIAKLAEELKIPVIVATGYPSFSEPIQITEFAVSAPETTVVLTNGGQYNISGLSQIDANLALQAPNVYIHTTGVYRDDWIQHVVDQYGPERVLFASASPQMSISYELRRVQLAHIDESFKPLLLGKNAERLFLSDGW